MNELGTSARSYISITRAVEFNPHHLLLALRRGNSCLAGNRRYLYRRRRHSPYNTIVNNLSRLLQAARLSLFFFSSLFFLFFILCVVVVMYTRRRRQQQQAVLAQPIVSVRPRAGCINDGARFKVFVRSSSQPRPPLVGETITLSGAGGGCGIFMRLAAQRIFYDYYRSKAAAEGPPSVLYIKQHHNRHFQAA